MRNIYSFYYEDKGYTCYMLESLKNYFSKIIKENEFYIVVNANNIEIFLQPSSFFQWTL